MGINPNLKEYYTRNKALPVYGIIILTIVFGYFASSLLNLEKDEQLIETISGLAIRSDERLYNGAKKEYLIVSLKTGEEILVSLPSYLDIQLGSEVLIQKIPASEESGLSWNYRFEKYLN